MVQRFLRDESGATMVEYAILVSLISIAAYAVIYTLGVKLEASYNSSTQKMTNAGI